MNKLQKSIKIVSIILVIQTMIWLVFTIISMSDVKPNWNTVDYVRWVSEPNIFFIGNYINATILTFIAIILFSLIYNLLYQNHKISANTALVFIPIYGLLNIFCYSIQIKIVPLISQNALNNLDVLYLSSQLIQANNQTLVGYLNGLAYAILGIPSIIFGLLLMKEKFNYSGAFLFLNGVFCILGIIGYMINNSIIASGIMVGGVLFLISLIFMAIEFKYDK